MGKYTDPTFGEFTADFITQFNCIDNFEFPEEMTKVTSLELILRYNTFFGDSLNSMRLQIDTLNRIIPEKDTKTFYTNVDPKEYYNENAKPIAMKAYSAGGASVDTIYHGSPKTYQQVVKLPTKLGEYIHDKYKENKDYFKDSEAFINNVLKGLYIRCTHGDGTILYINELMLIIRYQGLIENSAGVRDSVVYKNDVFAATKEVIQANRFQNKSAETLKELIEDKNNSYLKTPAGILTEATLPISQIYEEHLRDTLNAASLSFVRKNTLDNIKYKMDAPSYLLMLRKQDLYSFFENNKMYDNQTSFIAEFTTSTNTYSFANISRLITYCITEKEKGEKEDPEWLAKNPDWNKVVLIPVQIDQDSQSNIIGIQNSLEIESAQLKGGENNPVELQILYTTF